jgi:hemerythrin-like metal-binding protein
MFEWIDRYNTGVAKIDDQHRHIVRCINELMVDHDALRVSDTVEHLLKSLEDYISTHLAAEEELMIKIAYPGFNLHKEKHNFFIQKFEEFKESLRDGNRHRSVSAKLLVFLSEWFLEHIQVEDQKYVPYINNEDLSS